MRKYLKDQLDDKNKIQEYLCPNCRKKYNALDVSRLISMEDMNFHCESCNAELVAETDNVGDQDVGDGDDNARKRSREKYNDMLQRMELQLKPLVEQLNRVKDLAVPELGSLQAWEARALAAARANGGNGSDPRSSSAYGTTMPFVGEPKVEVAISGVDDVGGNGGAQNGSGPMKVLPPWMIKQGMNLTKEQRGEVKEEMDGSSAGFGSSDDKKKTVSEPEDSKKNLQDEYIKAYYAAIAQRQAEQDEALRREQELAAAAASASERVVGEKSKREDNDDGEDVEWEEEAPTGGDNTSGNFKVDLNLNVEAGVSEDDEDDIDWEEG